MKNHKISVNFSTYRHWQRSIVEKGVKRKEISLDFLEGEMEEYIDEGEAALLQGAHTLRTADVIYGAGRDNWGNCEDKSSKITQKVYKSASFQSQDPLELAKEPLGEIRS